jgi:hypothetical protein
MKKLFIVLLLSVFAINVFADQKIFDGYIINMQDKRVEGRIKIKRVTVDEVKITFTSEGKKSVYKPTDILGYGYQYFGKDEFGSDAYNWRHYKSKEAISYAPVMFAAKTVFMEVMEAGSVIVYDYYVEKRTNIESPYDRFFYLEREGSDEWIEVTEENYIAVVSVFFRDNIELAEKIGTVNHRFHHLSSVVRLHNDWMKKQNKSMSDYTENKPF